MYKVKSVFRIVALLGTFLLLALCMQNWIVPLRVISIGHLYGDAITLLYIMLWGMHALTHCLTSYYDAPFFYPLHHPVLGTDGMELQTILLAPIWYLTKNPPLVSNIDLIFSHLFSLIALYYCLRRVTAISTPLAIALAFVGTACSDRFWHSMDHHNLIFTGILPLVFVLTWKLFENTTWKSVLFLALAFGLSVYLSVYFFVLSCFAILTAVLCWMVTNWKIPKSSQIVKFGGACMGGGILALGKILIYYVGSRSLKHTHDSLFEAGHLSATWTGYLRPIYQENRFISRWYEILAVPGENILTQEDGQFIGFAVIFLCIVESLRLIIMATRKTWDRWDRLSAFCLLSSFIYIILSFGPAFTVFDVSPYKVIYYTFLKYTSFYRAPARFAFLSTWTLLLPIAILFKRLPRLRIREMWLISAALIGCTFFEHFPQKAHVYNTFAKMESIKQLDVFDPSATQPYIDLSDNMTVYSGLSTPPHFRPTVNGWLYSALGEDFDRRYIEFMDFPTTGGLAWLADNKVKWIVSAMPDIKARSRNDSRLNLAWTNGNSDIYVIRDPEKVLNDQKEALLAVKKSILENRAKQPDLVSWPSNPVIAPLNPNVGAIEINKSATVSILFANLKLNNLALYDIIEIEYKLDAPTNHLSCLYWEDSHEPMSEYRRCNANVRREGDKFIAVLDGKGIKPWYTDNDLKTLRFDFYGLDSFKPAVLSIEKITFKRHSGEIDIPLM